MSPMRSTRSAARARRSQRQTRRRHHRAVAVGAEPRRQPARVRALRWRHRLEYLAFPPRRRWHGSAGHAQVQQVLRGLVGARQLGRLLQPLSAQARTEGRRGRARRRCGPARRVLPQAGRCAVGGSPGLPGHRSPDARALGRRSPKTAAISSSACSTATKPTPSLVQDLRKPGAKPQPLFAAWDALYNFIGSKGDELYFQTTNDAPRGRVIAVNAARSGAREVAHRRAARRHRDQRTPATSAAASSSNTRATRAASCGCSRRAARRRAK